MGIRGLTPWWRASLFLLVAALAWAVSSRVADAAAWPATGPVLLGFGQQYPAADGSRTHRGADLGSAPGEEVRSPVDGVVSFVGEVPAMEGTGTRVLCVTILAGTDRWSMLPLEGVRVSAGETVRAGDPVGSVAAEGDPSSSAPHVHLGLRRSGAYADPVPELAEIVAPDPDPASEPNESPGAPPPDGPQEAPQTPPMPEVRPAREPVVPGASHEIAAPAHPGARPSEAAPTPVMAGMRLRAAPTRTGLRQGRDGRLVPSHASARRLGMPATPTALAESPREAFRGPVLALMLAAMVCAAVIALGNGAVRAAAHDLLLELAPARAGPGG